MSGHVRAKVAVLGIGNTLAGDDGVGIEIANWLGEKWGGREEILLGVLEGDLFAVTEWLDRAERFIFVDAVAAEQPGKNVILREYQAGLSASLHHSDIGAVMATLRTLKMVDEFPSWEVWGITICLPQELGVGLSEPVRWAAQLLVADLDQYLAELVDCAQVH